MSVELLDDFDQFGAILLDVSLRFDNIDYTEPLTDLQTTFAEGEAEAFAGQRTPGGDPWQALSPVTVKRKGHSVILFETGALKESLITVGGPGNIHPVDRRGMLFGTEDEKAPYHTFGGPRLPIREHVGTNDETVDEFAETVADFVVDKLKYKRGP